MNFRTSKNMVYHNWQGVLTFELLAEDFLFSAGGGFLFGAVAGYAIKKVMKLAAIVIGLFVAGPGPDTDETPLIIHFRSGLHNCYKG